MQLRFVDYCPLYFMELREQLDTAGRHDEVSQLVRFLQAVEMIVTRRHKFSKSGVPMLVVRWHCLP
jgi:hypothetical protein